MTPTAAADAIRETLDTLFAPGQVIELRQLGPKKNQINAGYFTDREKLIAAALARNGQVPQYVVANIIDPRLLSRYNNRVEPWASSTTKDEDVRARRWLPFDFDPERPSGIPASNEEHAEAHQRALDCCAWLASYGWPEPVYADSGNGAWLLYRLPDLPNTDAVTAKIQRAIEIVHLFYNGVDRDNGITINIDRTIYNAARIVRLFGTENLKGDGDEGSGRRNRASRILRVPDPSAVLTMDAIDRLLAAFPEEKDEPQHTNGQARNGSAWGKAKVETFITHYHLDVAYDAEYQDGHKWVLAECPFNPAHNDKSAVIILRSSGRLGFKCHHNGCNGKDWKALRSKLEPTYGQQAAQVDTAARRNGTTATPEPRLADTLPTHFRLYRGAAIDQVAAPRQLVKGYLSIGTVAILVGPSEAGKSTIAVDLVNKVAPHYGVIYVAGEDGANVRAQIRAWELLHQRRRAENLGLVDGPIRLNDDEEISLFIAAARTMSPRLVVFDTLSSCIPGLDENAPEMTQVTYNLNRIADELSAAVLVLHHPLKYDGETFRGHSSLMNNTHTMMVVQRDEGDDVILLKVIRHKGARAAPTTLRIIVRETDIVDPDDGVLAAPVVLPAARVLLSDDHLSARQKAILQYLYDIDADGGATNAEIAREIATRFKTTEGVVRKDIASLVRRRLMTAGERQRDPRVITAEGRLRIESDQVDQADQVLPADPFTVNTRLNEPAAQAHNLIHRSIAIAAHHGAQTHEPDPTRSAPDPEQLDQVPVPAKKPDPPDPVLYSGSGGSGFAAGEITQRVSKAGDRHQNRRSARPGLVEDADLPPDLLDVEERIAGGDFPAGGGWRPLVERLQAEKAKRDEKT